MNKLRENMLNLHLWRATVFHLHFIKWLPVISATSWGFHWVYSFIPYFRLYRIEKPRDMDHVVRSSIPRSSRNYFLNSKFSKQNGCQSQISCFKKLLCNIKWENHWRTKIHMGYILLGSLVHIIIHLFCPAALSHLN